MLSEGDAALRVLIVEDDRQKAKIVRRVIESALPGARVEHAETLLEAMEEACLRLPTLDLVVTDWIFPWCRGGAALDCGHHIIALAGDLGVPCVVVSGHPSPPGFRGTWITTDRVVGELPPALRDLGTMYEQRAADRRAALLAPEPPAAQPKPEEPEGPEEPAR